MSMNYLHLVMEGELAQKILELEKEINLLKIESEGVRNTKALKCDGCKDHYPVNHSFGGLHKNFCGLCMKALLEKIE